MLDQLKKDDEIDADVADAAKRLVTLLITVLKVEVSLQEEIDECLDEIKKKNLKKALRQFQKKIDFRIVEIRKSLE